MDNPTGTILRIGAWHLNVAAGELTQLGSTVRLDPRLVRVLLCLAERAGEVVSTEALLQAVWGEVVVTPDSVYQAVASLRRSLGDNPRKPEYIATVARVGYRLIAPVGPADTVRKRAVGNEARAPTGRSRIGPRARRFAFIGLAVTAIILAVVVSILALQRAASPAPQTIAVLPFLDLTSQSMDQEYFADGMTEELIGRLSQIPGVRVSSASASFYYKSKNLSAAQIGAALGVRYLLDGSVRQSGDTLRVTARLLQAEDGFVIWTQTYEEASHDALKVQDSIARSVTQSMRKSLVPGT
jgi:TolB-like protein/DNA-binding winged helix-turn-helix (wHTH) protein